MWVAYWLSGTGYSLAGLAAPRLFCKVSQGMARTRCEYEFSALQR